MLCFWIVNCVSALLLCVVFTAFAIPRILVVAFRKRLFDEPDERKIHRLPIPRLGGLAFMPAIIFSLVLLLGTDVASGYGLELTSVAKEDIPAFAFGFCAIVALYIVGVVDDLVGVGYRIKFVVQVISAVLLVAGAVCVTNLHGMLGVYDLPLWVVYPLTVLLVVYVINAINLIDGVDGLAAGLCVCACSYYAVMFFLFGKYLHAMIAIATVGVLIAYFYYNVFGTAEQRTKILMGDTGSMTLGAILSFLSIELLHIEELDVLQSNVMVLAFSPLLIPCFDVVRVFLNRIRNKKNPFLPDKTHIHHKLLAVGFGQRKTMMIIVFCAVVFLVLNILLSLQADVNFVFAVDIVVWVLLNTWLSRYIKSMCKK